MKLVINAIIWIVIMAFFTNNAMNAEGVAVEVLKDYTEFRPEITDKAKTKIKGKKGREYEAYFIHYKYEVNNQTYTGKTEVSEELFQQFKNPKVTRINDYIYWNQDPKEHGPLAEYEATAGIFGGEAKYTVLAIAAGVLAVIMLLINLMFFSPKKEEELTVTN